MVNLARCPFRTVSARFLRISPYTRIIRHGFGIGITFSESRESPNLLGTTCGAVKCSMAFCKELPWGSWLVHEDAALEQSTCFSPIISANPATRSVHTITSSPFMRLYDHWFDTMINPFRKISAKNNVKKDHGSPQLKTLKLFDILYDNGVVSNIW